MTRASLPRAETLVTVAMLWLTMAIAAVALWPIYESTGLVLVVIVGLIAGTVVALLGARWRWPGWLTMIAMVVAFLAVGVPTAVPSKAQFVVLPTVEGMADLITSVALGWRQLLTISLPVGSYEALLVPALVMVLLATTIGLSIALRATYPELAVLAPIALYLLAIAFGPSEPVSAVVVPIALLVTVLLWLVWFRWRRRRAAIRVLLTPTEAAGSEASAAGLRTALGAVLILALSSGAAVAAAASLPPAEDRTVLRSTVQQPFDPRAYVSPLSGFRGYWQTGAVDEVLFTVSGASEASLVRLATLDTYDGVVFSVGSDQISTASGSFTRVPSTVDRSDVAGVPVEIDVAVEGYSGVWLPTVGLFESITFEGATATERRNAFFFNSETGGAAVLGGITSGDRYTLTAVAPTQPTVSELSELDPGAATVPDAVAVPEEVVTTLDGYIAGVEGAGAQLVAMLDGLATQGYISHGVGDDEPPSRSGHAADRIAELLSAPRMIGDAEQYAVTAALMARELGFASRVVMGFVANDGIVRGGDVVAWIEVNTAQYGWVLIDATPPFREIPDELPEDNSQVSRPPTIVPPPLLESEDPNPQSAPDSERELPPDLNPLLQIVLAILRVIGWVLLVAAIAISPFLVIIAAKARRRRLRRRAPSPGDSITGGWNEFEDAVIDHGLSPSPSATRSEVASIVGSTQSQVLAAVADRAAFAPEAPEGADAEHVWRAVDELRLSLDQGKTRWQRMKARISLRSLGGYSVSKLFTR